MQPGPLSPGGFDCDTDHSKCDSLTASEIITDGIRVSGGYDNRALLLTGGEPTLQVDGKLLETLREYFEYIAIETNGTVKLPPAELDWVSVSPKFPTRHPLRDEVIKRADEVRFVITTGQKVLEPMLPISPAALVYVSPATRGNEIDEAALAWCIEKVKDNPRLRLSVQQHKVWKIK
jgi:organic radical activating enzyme